MLLTITPSTLVCIYKICRIACLEKYANDWQHWLLPVETASLRWILKWTGTSHAILNIGEQELFKLSVVGRFKLFLLCCFLLLGHYWDRQPLKRYHYGRT